MIGLTAALALFAAATPAIEAQTGPHGFVPGPVRVKALTYGSEPRQTVELFTKAKAGRAPMAVYLHGGGWSAGTPKAGSARAQAEFYTARGFAYATIGYRFVPGATVEQQLQDAASAIALLRTRPEVDGERVVLVGHSSGTQLAGMLASDPAWFERAGLKFASIRGVVMLDPSGLDLPPVLATRGGTVDRFFRPAFGDDPARWSALSPVTHVAAPNAPDWLILHDVANLFAANQGGAFSAGLIAAGARTRVQSIAGTTHLRLNDEIGQPGDPASAQLDAFLAEIMPDTRRPRFR